MGDTERLPEDGSEDVSSGGSEIDDGTGDGSGGEAEDESGGTGAG
ncbi:MAG: hypothetical protein ACYCV7_12080 [Acidimicrobiales bacterium]